ncbi:hypothetical protein U9M48_009007 [Paspalum notatum var. saurae]|uniref:Protein TIFY n=1 Tax=Paspalum notatum var. saurae TaxID=547442 RepID=A0AAQ3WEA1_PASNO
MAPMAAEASCSGRRRFAVACSVLSRCVRAEAAAAAGNTAPAPAPARSSSPTMLLMPGADVVREEEEKETAQAEAAPAHQLTIMYGGRVLVFDDVAADTAAKLMRVAVAARRDTPPHGLPADLQVARKASLQRLMEKRRDRLAARAPYAAPDARPPAAAAAAAPKGQVEEGHAAGWLGLGLGAQRSPEASSKLGILASGAWWRGGCRERAYVMAAVDCNGHRRFAMACGVLSQCVKAAGAAVGNKVAAAPAPAPAAPHPHPAAPTMLLMPGADVAPDAKNAETEAAPAQAQLTIVYGGRVLVFDDVPADTAAEMVRVAARQDGPPGAVVTDFPVARKASLQRFMQKRRDRLDALAPYASAMASKKKKAKQEGDAGCWLGLGTPAGGGCAR